MPKIITQKMLEETRRKACFKDQEVESMSCVLSENLPTSMWNLLTVAENINPQKYVHQKQMAWRLGAKTRKINEAMPEVRSLALAQGKMLANKFGAGYKIAGTEEAIHEMGKGLQRIMAHSKSLVVAIAEANDYNWEILKGTPAYDLFMMNLKPATFYLRGFMESHEKALHDFKQSQKLLEEHRYEVTRPLFE